MPDWLLNSLTSWLRERLWTARDGGLSPKFNRALAERMDRRLRRPELKPALDALHGADCWGRIQSIVREDGELFLEVVDFVLSVTSMVRTGQWPTQARSLEGLLDEAGSAWCVALQPGATNLRLERRVDATIRDSAMEVMTGADRSSEHLRNGWEALYGRSPSAGEGYREAVRAVEGAAKPVVLPLDDRATLGRMIPAFRDAPNKWTIRLNEAGRSDPHGVVVGMMEMLWTSQHDRHGTDDQSIPMNVTVEEARAALHLAITLVQWFRTGVVAATT